MKIEDFDLYTAQLRSFMSSAMRQINKQNGNQQRFSALSPTSSFERTQFSNISGRLQAWMPPTDAACAFHMHLPIERVKY